MVFMFYLYYVLNVKYFGQHLLFLPITNSWLWNIHNCGNVATGLTFHYSVHIK